MSEEEELQRALRWCKALCFLSNDDHLHWCDRKGLIVDYVRYMAKKSIADDGAKSVRVRNRAGTESIIAKQKVIRYFDTLYEYNSFRVLNILFGEDWEHVVVDGSIKYKYDE